MDKEDIEKIKKLLDKREETKYIYENNVIETLFYTHIVINDKKDIKNLSKQNGLWPTIITHSGTLELRWMIDNQEIKHKKISLSDILKMYMEINVDFYDKLPYKLRSDKKLVEILNQSEYKHSWLGILSTGKCYDDEIHTIQKPILITDINKKESLEYIHQWENKYTRNKISKL